MRSGADSLDADDEEILTMDAASDRRNKGSASRHRRNGARALIAQQRSRSSVRVSSNLAECVIPALLMRISSRPNVSCVT